MKIHPKSIKTFKIKKRFFSGYVPDTAPLLERPVRSAPHPGVWWGGADGDDIPLLFV